MSDGDTEKANRLINTHSQFSGEATTEWLRLLSAYSDLHVIRTKDARVKLNPVHSRSLALDGLELSTPERK
jgi:hypothetical protein